MGKTNPTYRDQIRAFEQEWSTFRDWLRRRHQPHFDQLVEHAQNHADAGGAQNPVEPKWAILVSICLAQQRELTELEEEVTILEGDA